MARKAIEQEVPVEIEFDHEGRTYRVLKDQRWLLRGPHGATPIPMQDGYSTLERDVLSGDVIVVNWSAVPVFRLVIDD